MALGDDLWGGETGLVKLEAESARLRETVEECQQELRRLVSGKADAEQLRRVKDEVFETLRSTQHSVVEVRESVPKVVADVKEHFRAASNTIAAQNAQMLADTRKQYQQEQGKISELREELVEFMEKSKAQMAELEKSQTSSRSSTELIVESFTQNVADLHKKRKVDKSSVDAETKQMKKRLDSIFETSESAFRAVEHIASVITTMMEASNVAGELDIQDDWDRQSVALMGFKDKDSKEAAGLRRASTGPNQKSHGPVMTVDNRCLSCSGQSSQVLAGFKIACLQYRPTPVEYKSQTWERCELLEYRKQILTQASEQLREGLASTIHKSHNSTESPECVEETRRKVTPVLHPPFPREMSKTPRDAKTPRRDVWTPTTQISRPGTSLGDSRRPPVTKCGMLDLEDTERQRPHTRDGFTGPRSGGRSYRATNKFR